MSGQTIAVEGRGSYAGDGILASQEQTNTFKHVSKTWQEQCLTFDAAKAVLAEDQQKIEDFHSPLSEWEVIAKSDGISFHNRLNDRQYKPTEHALNLMCAVGKGMSTWAVKSLCETIPHATKKNKDGTPVAIKGGERTLADYNVLRDYINVHLFNADRVDQSKPRLWRTWQDGTLRALLSEQYCIVNNMWFMDILHKAVPGGLVSHWRGDADAIWGNVLIPDTIRQESDSDFGGMLSIGNSEIGTRRISSQPSVFRAICMNGCIHGQELGKALNKVHRGDVDFDTLKAAIIDNLESQIPLLPQGIQRVLGLRAYGCGDTNPANLVVQTAIDNKLNKHHVRALFDGWNEERKVLGDKDSRTAYALMNAVTRGGQEFDNDTWVRFDGIAGQMSMLDVNGWDKFRNRAGNLSKDQLEKWIGVAV